MPVMPLLTMLSTLPRFPLPSSHCVPPLSRHAIQRSQRWRDVPELALSKQSTALAALNALAMNRNRTSVDMDIIGTKHGASCRPGPEVSLLQLGCVVKWRAGEAKRPFACGTLGEEERRQAVWGAQRGGAGGWRRRRWGVAGKGAAELGATPGE